jgi:DNA-binding transcriptional MerR regulator
VTATRTPTATVTLVRWTAGPRAGDTLDIDALAREAGLHPDLVRRFVDLGLLTPVGGTSGAPRFTRDAGALLASAARLRRDLGIGYAGAVLACELLARIDHLEARLRRYEPRVQGPRS